jgi:hypothetical protein
MERNDNKTNMSFRVPIEFEKLFHTFHAELNSMEKITKADLFMHIINGYVNENKEYNPPVASKQNSQLIAPKVKELLQPEKPTAGGSIYE